MTLTREPAPSIAAPRRRRPLAVAAMATALVVLVVYAITQLGDDDELAARRAQVEKAGAGVMPFDLDRTTHVFTNLPDGGRQVVTANDPADAVQIELIRQHLREEAEKFRRGDFTDPAAIHGNNMPGLAELKAAAGRVDVRYDELPAGAQLTYRSSDPVLVAGIHSWFKAQSTDHGAGHR